jgi:hypothetical protein
LERVVTEIEETTFRLGSVEAVLVDEAFESGDAPRQDGLSG